MSESGWGWTTAPGAVEHREELTAQHGIHVGLLGRPTIHAPVSKGGGQQPGSPATETCCPTLMMEYASKIRGHAFAPLYFYDYEPGAKTHPTNLWALDDCVPEDLDVVDGELHRVIFLGMLNPAAAIHLPARPFFETCVAAMDQVARWDYQMLQVTIPADIPCHDKDLAVRGHQAMANPNGWVTCADHTTPVRMDFTATGEHATTELAELVADLAHHNHGYLASMSESVADGRQLRPLFDIDNVTHPGHTVSVTATAKRWGPDLISGLVGWLAARIAQRDVSYRALTMTICPTDADQPLEYETFAMFDRNAD